MFARLSFSGALEAAYRRHLNRRYRWSRVIFFGICAASFLVSPAFNRILFEVPDATLPLTLWIQWGWALPVLTLAAVAPLYVTGARPLGAINVAGNLTLWAAVLSMHWLHLMGQINYPLHVVNFAVMAVAFFGGFRVRLIILGGSLTIGMSLLAVLIGVDTHYPVKHFVYESLYFWLIGIGGLVTIDLLNRDSYLNRLRIRTISETDALTGVLNRGAFDLLYARAVGQAARDRRWMAVALIDLDHFKRINDTYGHGQGDDVLRLAGQAMRALPLGRRPLDIRARYGGEEFVLVCYDVRPDELATLAQTLLRGIREIGVAVEVGKPPLRLSTSVGLVAAIPGAAADGPRLIQAADRLLYRAKGAGRDRACIATGVDADGEIIGTT